MYRFVGILVLLIGLLSCIVFNPKQQEQTIIYNSKHYVKKINTPNGLYCSSVYINFKNEVRHITNAHCCGKSLYIDNIIMKTIKIDQALDLCELKDLKIPKNGIDISNKLPEITDIVYIVGFPADYGLTIDMGRIASDLTPSGFNGQILYQTTAFAFGGSSGGATLDENGKLIGITVQTNTVNHGMFIPMKDVVNFLNQ